MRLPRTVGPWPAGDLAGLGFVGPGQRHDRRTGDRRSSPASPATVSRPCRSDEALQLFDTALIVDEPFVVPAHIDLAALRAKFDGGTLPPMFVDLINAPTRRQVGDSLAAEKSKSALLQRLEGLPEDEQDAMLLDLVRLTSLPCSAAPAPSRSIRTRRSKSWVLIR